MNTSPEIDQVPATAPNLRTGEVRSEVGLCQDAGIVFVGMIRTPWTKPSDCPRQGDPENGPECHILLDLLWEPALEGINLFDRVQVLYWFHHARRDLLMQTPRHSGGVHGIFSLRSPMRPNPVGVSSVRLLSLQGTTLVVRGLDCIDETPVIDLKPDICPQATRAAPQALE